MTIKGALFHNTDYVWALQSGVRSLVPWAHVSYDYGGFRNDAEPSRITIPDGFNAEGYTQARLTGQFVFEHNTNGIRQTVIKKNYSPVPPLCDGFYPAFGAHNGPATAGTTTDLMAQTPWLEAIDGDYFQLEALQDSGAVGYVMGSGCWFQIEVR